jgi:putative tryptophan/tyrosine transport system substrate-binding protein
MKRRQFIAALGAASACPQPLWAQVPAKIPEVGFLYTGKTATGTPRIAAFLEGLRSKGYVDGRNIALVARIAESNFDRFEPFTAELVARNVRVLFVTGQEVIVRLAGAATTKIPIVALNLEIDPVKDGFVASIAHPGGNITGIFFDFPQISAKWLELLTECVAGLSRLAVLWDLRTGPRQLDTVRAEADLRGLSLQLLKVSAPGEVEAALASAADAKADGLLILSSAMFGADPKLIADLALKYRLPAISLFPDFAQAGGVMAYGPNVIDLHREAGVWLVKFSMDQSRKICPSRGQHAFNFCSISKRQRRSASQFRLPCLRRPMR